jgi:hypothetical protein
MRISRTFSRFLGIASVFLFVPLTATAQQNQGTPVAPASPTPTESSLPVRLAPVNDPATPDQIEQYLRITGALDAYRQRWIASVDKNRDKGEPYWPESFWAAIKDEMAKADLMPMYVMLFQHIASRQSMQDALDAYQRLGAVRFRSSEAYEKIAQAEYSIKDDEDRLTLANTNALIQKVYAAYKPQIKAARARYLAEHPDRKD